MAEFKNPFDQPDTHLRDLAVQINAKARQGKVLFFSRQGEVSAVFSNGPKRVVVQLGGRPSEIDVDDLVQALESWAGFQSEAVPYSTEVPPLPESGW